MAIRLHLPTQMRNKLRMRRIAIFLLAVVFLSLGGFWLLSLRTAIAPQETRAKFSAESVALGEKIAAEAHCASCHTTAGGPAFAGGYGVHTPFGIIYGTNITPDPKTGIGLWSIEAFTRAMREGISRDGSHLFPAFPYWAYTKLSDEDVQALYAYLMTRPAVSAKVPSNTITFPLNIRALQEGWNFLFFTGGRFRKVASKNDEWNRGAYLAEAVADCSGCHTPRNALGGETQKAYAGALIDGWIAPALTAANPSPIPWTQDELISYLRTGASRLHGATAGTMTEVIRGSLALPIVPDSDIRALAVYFTDMADAGDRASGIEANTREAISASSMGTSQEHDPDADLYVSACIACHYNSGSAPQAARPELALDSALTSSDPTNFIQTVLYGVGANEGAAGLVMPAYASSLNDQEIARLAAYLRRTRTKGAPWGGLESKVSAIRRQSAR
jgi:mono/diheme cytochrome c family protein